ncbi:hypothetical protein HKT41_29330, partial [Pseudomonas aeruginosa]|nr:hypothetical protein [Pseudomonas aeruginosa]
MQISKTPEEEGKPAIIAEAGAPGNAAPLGDLQRLAEFPLVLPLAGTTIR